MCKSSHVHVKLNVGFRRQKQRSTTGRLFASKLDLKLKEETGKVLKFEHSFVWCSKMDTSESGKKHSWKY